MKNFSELALKLHAQKRGKIEIISKVEVKNTDDLSTVYSPGVAEPCREIAKNPDNVYKYTAKGNLVAVITDGTAVLGLGDIGPKAALPVMEGKAILFKQFADIDAFPICLDTKNVEEIIQTVKFLAPTFGGINLEDISSPRCVEIEERLKKELDIPVFHDDQHGTAIVVVAGLLNALKIVKKDLQNIKVAVNGAGAAGIAIVKMLLNVGVKNIIVCDSKGIIGKNRVDEKNELKLQIANLTNYENIEGGLEDAVKNADVFIGVSVANVLSEEMVKSMNKDAVIFALANPNPEIEPNLALKSGAKIVGTGRSDYPNQINNVLVFPGIFKGALNAGAKKIDENMKVTAAFALAGLISDEELNENYIIPNPFDERVAKTVALAVEKCVKNA